MTARDAYRDTKKELDKYESPTFSIRDFNYFYNKAVSRYIDDNYRKLDLVLKDTQDLSWTSSISTPLTFSTTGSVAVPSGFRHLLSLKIKVKFKVDMGRYKKDNSYEFWPERMKSGQKGFRNRSAYGRPNFKRYYYEISGNTLQILFDSSVVEFVISSPNAWLDYISQPTDVYLNPNTDSDYNQAENNSVLLFNTGTSKNNIYYEVVNVCRAIFLENIESPRAGFALQESSLQ